jgi:hypothetical protein
VAVNQDSESQSTSVDGRRVFRIVVDVLATGEQVAALQEVIGEAICGAPGLHPGPCRIAWSIAHTTEDEDEDDPDVSYGLDREAVDAAYEHLQPVKVWPRSAVDASLGLT